MATTLWTPADLAVTSVLVVVGALLWFLGWYSASDKLVEGDQIAALNLSAAGTLLAGAGGVSWFLNGRRSIRSRRRRLVEHRRAHLRPGVVQHAAASTAPAATTKETLAPRASSPLLVAGPSLRRFHRADCPLAAGRNWKSAERVAHEAAGRTACGACRP